MKRASRKQWEARVKAWKESGDSAAAFARQRGISARSLRRWRWRLTATADHDVSIHGAPPPPVNFVEMPVRDIPFDQDGDLLEVILPSKVAVRVRPGFEGGALNALLDLLERRR